MNGVSGVFYTSKVDLDDEGSLEFVPCDFNGLKSMKIETDYVHI